MVSIGVAVLLMLFSASAVTADNWGAGTTDPSYRCLKAGDPEEWNSECVTEDSNWYVYIDSDIPSTLATAFENSVNNDYNQWFFFAKVQSNLNSNTDTRVKTADIPGSFPYAIYTTCASNAEFGGGSGYYKWCKKQVIKFDPTDPPNNLGRAQDVLNEKAFFACHELGHTTGLQHPSPLHNNPRVTCMDYDGSTVLDDHDYQHLLDCFPIPNPAPYYLTTLCRDYQPPPPPCDSGTLGPCL